MDNLQFRYNIEGLSKEMGVPLDLLAELYLEYFHEMKENLQMSRALCDAGDWSKLERVIHNIKGISVSLNVVDVHSAAENLDRMLKALNNNPAHQYLEHISELFTYAEKDIREFFKKRSIPM